MFCVLTLEMFRFMKRHFYLPSDYRRDAFQPIKNTILKEIETLTYADFQVSAVKPKQN